MIRFTILWYCTRLFSNRKNKFITENNIKIKKTRARIPKIPEKIYWFFQSNQNGVFFFFIDSFVWEQLYIYVLGSLCRSSSSSPSFRSMCASMRHVYWLYVKSNNGWLKYFESTFAPSSSALCNAFSTKQIFPLNI